MNHIRQFKAQIKQHTLLAYPMVITRMSIMFIGIADHLMVGKLGATSLAALSLAEAIIWPFSSFCIGVSYGVAPLVASAHATCNYARSTALLKHALIINIVLSSMLCVIIMQSIPIIRYIGQEAKVACLVVHYLRTTSVSLVPFMIFWTFREYLIGLSLTKECMYLTIIHSITQILLNYTFIYGSFGIPAMGFLGAGWGVVLSHTIKALIMGIYVLGTTQLRRYRVGWKQQLCRKLFVSLLKIGIPASVGLMLESAIYASLGIMTGWISAEIQAGYTIASNLNDICSISMGAIAMATTLQVSNKFGVRDFCSLRRSGFLGCIIGGVVMGFSLFFLLLGRYRLSAFYTHEATVLHLAASLVIVVGILDLLGGMIKIVNAALRSIEDTIIPPVITAVSHWVVGIPLGYLLCFKLQWGAKGIFGGLIIAQICIILILLIRFDRKSKPSQISQTLVLPDDYLLIPQHLKT